jgi:hypothetical protein
VQDRAALRASRRALPINVAFAVGAGAALWAAHRYFALPAYAAWFLFALFAMGVIGDSLNVVYLERKLRRRGNLP